MHWSYAAAAPLLEDALIDRDQVHRFRGESITTASNITHSSPALIVRIEKPSIIIRSGSVRRELFSIPYENALWCLNGSNKRSE